MKLHLQTTAFVFPGQGSQSVGMGRGLAAQYPIAHQTFEEADSILGFPLSRLMWEGPEAELNETVNTQPALYVHSIAAWRTFSSLTPLNPAALAGHSLGELSALAASGALSFDDGLRLVRKRGELMKQAGEIAPGSMAASTIVYSSSAAPPPVASMLIAASGLPLVLIDTLPPLTRTTATVAVFPSRLNNTSVEGSCTGLP